MKTLFLFFVHVGGAVLNTWLFFGSWFFHAFFLINYLYEEELFGVYYAFEKA